MISTSDNIRIQALISCEPSRCTKDQCPLYIQEKKLCDAKRAIDTFRIAVYQKLKDIKCYDPIRGDKD